MNLVLFEEIVQSSSEQFGTIAKLAQAHIAWRAQQPSDLVR
jgi:hypothetical protein